MYLYFFNLFHGSPSETYSIKPPFLPRTSETAPESGPRPVWLPGVRRVCVEDVWKLFCPNQLEVWKSAVQHLLLQVKRYRLLIAVMCWFSPWTADLKINDQGRSFRKAAALSRLAFTSVATVKIKQALLKDANITQIIHRHVLNNLEYTYRKLRHLS